MVDVQEERHVETYDDEVMKMKAAAADLSLVHLLGKTPCTIVQVKQMPGWVSRRCSKVLWYR